MKYWLFPLLLVFLLALAFAPAAWAQSASAPVGGCPDGFELHPVMHEGNPPDHMHNHIGSSYDLNADGYLCVMHVGASGNRHLHIDNYFPLP